MNKLTNCLTAGVLILLICTGSAIGEQSPVDAVHDTLKQMGVEFSGTIEVEAAYQDTDTGDTSDITLATVELGIDIKPVKHVSGHIVLLFEEDDTEPMEIDQGYIRLDGEDKCPFYADAGRLYLPFGSYDSHFITDPLTQDLGETRESALVLGYRHDLFEFSLGLFNGDVNEANEDDDMIDGVNAAAVFSMPPQGGLSISAGVSYLSNIGDSNGLAEQLATADTITSYVPAAAAFVAANLNEVFFCTLEYVTATEDFTAGDLGYDGGSAKQPWALNVELAYVIAEQVEVGLRYGASDDGGDFLLETVYGAVINYAPVDHVGIGLEYQTGEYEDGTDLTSATVQLALEF